MDLSHTYPVAPKQLPKEVAGVEWPPKECFQPNLFRLADSRKNRARL